MAQGITEIDLRMFSDGAVFDHIDDFADRMTVITESGRETVPVEGVRFVVDRADSRGYHWEDYGGYYI